MFQDTFGTKLLKYFQIISIAKVLYSLISQLRRWVSYESNNWQLKTLDKVNACWIAINARLKATASMKCR